MTDAMDATIDRRSVLLAGGAGVVSLAGCLGTDPGSSGPQERTYTLTITRPKETLESRIEPAGEIADVVRVHVGDTVEFTVVNETDVPVGVHNHANDAEVVIGPGERRVLAFEASEAMTGRQEVEGWVADAGDEEAPDGHGAEATVLAVIEVRPRSG